MRDGRAVTFDYRRKMGPDVLRREVEPWGVVSWRGRWYLVGHDRGRDATRCFRLSRIVGEVRCVGPEGAVRRPADVDLLRFVAGSSDEPAPPTTVRLWVAEGRAHGLRRRGRPLRRVELDGEPGDVMEVDLHFSESADKWIAGYGPDVVVLEPDTLRRAVTELLEGAAGRREAGVREESRS
nr:hypothetical protein GCM10020241_59140 [Streptoalloteichus tenebrarius]